MDLITVKTAKDLKLDMSMSGRVPVQGMATN
jgi:hypothetical protein